MYREVQGDLFKADGVYGHKYPIIPIVHCVSSDYKLGAGIAKTIENAYEVKSELKRVGRRQYPDCIMTKNIINMVTKNKYWNKPTLENFRESLKYVAIICENQGIKEVVMPRIGSGIDKLPWENCRELINTEIVKKGIKVTVYYL